VKLANETVRVNCVLFGEKKKLDNGVEALLKHNQDNMITRYNAYKLLLDCQDINHVVLYSWGMEYW
jgi:hypothetical protein